MKREDSIKLDFISEINFGTLSGGMRNGMVSYEIVFNRLIPHRDRGTIPHILNLIRSHPGGAHKTVHLSGVYPEGFGQDYIFNLLDSLKELGYLISIELSGEFSYQWSKHEAIVYRSIYLKNPSNWVPIDFNELIMDINSLDTPEPRMPVRSGFRFLYLNPIQGFSPENLFKYIAEAKLPWNISAKCKRIKEYLYKGEK